MSSRQYLSESSSPEEQTETHEFRNTHKNPRTLLDEVAGTGVFMLAAVGFFWSLNAGIVPLMAVSGAVIVIWCAALGFRQSLGNLLLLVGLFVWDRMTGQGTPMSLWVILAAGTLLGIPFSLLRAGCHLQNELYYADVVAMLVSAIPLAVPGVACATLGASWPPLVAIGYVLIAIWALLNFFMAVIRPTLIAALFDSDTSQ